MLGAALFTRAMGAFRWLRDHYRLIQIGGGAVMVTLGLLLFFGRFWFCASISTGRSSGSGSRRRSDAATIGFTIFGTAEARLHDSSTRAAQTPY